MKQGDGSGAMQRAKVFHLLIWLMTAFSFGFSYKAYNQHSYLLGGLRELNPDFLSRDWVLQETTNYHGAFKWIVWSLGSVLGSDAGLGWALISIRFVIIFISFGAFSLLFVRLCRGSWERAILPALLLGLWVVAQLHHGPAVSYIIGRGMQPSTLGAMGYMLAIVAYASGKPRACGLALAVGGLFHTNFLVLGLAWFGSNQLYQMYRKRALLLEENLSILTPSLIIFATTLPTLLTISGQDPGGMVIFHKIRAPYHYDFGNYSPTVWGFLIWILVTYLSFRVIERVTRDEEQRALWSRLRGLWSVGALIVCAQIPIVAFELVPKVTQLFVWRIAPFVSLIGAIALFSALAPIARHLHDLSNPEGATDDSEEKLDERELRALGLAFCAFIALYRGAGIEPIATIGFVPWLFFGVYWLHSQRKHLSLVLSPSWRGAGISILGIMSVIVAYHCSNAPHFGPTDPTLTGVLEAAKARTPPDALFVIPPEVEDFRLHAERSVMVDWKTSPVIPAEIIAWYERIEAVSGVEQPRSLSQVWDGYEQMTPERLTALHNAYGVDHALVYRSSLAKITGCKVLHETDFWAVIALIPNPTCIADDQKVGAVLEDPVDVGDVDTDHTDQQKKDPEQ